MELLNLTNANFETLVQEHPLMVIEFTSEDCAPCRSLEQTMAAIAPEFPDVVFAQVNVELEPELTDEFSVRSIPATMVVRHQVVVFADSGIISATALTNVLNQAKAITE